MSTRDDILKCNDAKIEPVDVPEWPVSVYVRVMSGKSRDKFMSAVADRQKDGKVNPVGLSIALVVLTACDESGALLFTEADIPALEEKSAVAIQRIFDAAAALNGLTPAASEAARADFTSERS